MPGRCALNVGVVRVAQLLVPIVSVLSLVGVVKAADASVIVFPLDSRGVAHDTAAHGTQNVLAALRDVKGLEVVDPKAVAKRIGVDLTEQAKKCEYDVFCLVEVGEILEGDQVLIGHLRQEGEGASRHLELKLIVLDVLKASITDVLIWNVSAEDRSALGDAARTAGRRLFASSDVNVEWRIEPPDAKVTIYGDPLRLPPPGESVPFWSGVYHARLEAPGYHPLEKRIVVPQKPGGVVTVDITMEQDPLYVRERKSQPDVNPFDQASRREGSGISAKVVGAVPTDDGESSAFANPIAWAGVGGGVGAIVVGAIVMSGAQSRYNAVAEQPRFTPGETASAAIAESQREEEQSTYRTGSAVAFIGAAVALGGLGWMLVDHLLTSDAPKRSSRMSAVDDPSADRAARVWAAALYEGSAR